MLTNEQGTWYKHEIEDYLVLKLKIIPFVKAYKSSGYNK